MVKKPTKKKAFEMLLKLRDEGHNVDELLLYFAPTSAKKSRNAWEWVAKAVAKKDAWEQLTLLYVTNDGELQACDAHRLHWAKLDEPTEPGFYCPKTFLRLDPQPDLRFPDINRVKPTWDDETPLRKTGTKAFENGQVVYLFDNGQGANTLYIDQTEFVKIYGTPLNEKLFGESQFGRFVVMAVRL